MNQRKLSLKQQAKLVSEMIEELHKKCPDISVLYNVNLYNTQKGTYVITTKKDKHYLNCSHSTINCISYKDIAPEIQLANNERLFEIQYYEGEKK